METVDGGVSYPTARGSYTVLFRYSLTMYEVQMLTFYSPWLRLLRNLTAIQRQVPIGRRGCPNDLFEQLAGERWWI
jgi:hypothetical protein